MTSFSDVVKERTLGVKWDVTNDKFTFESVAAEKEAVTK